MGVRQESKHELTRALCDRYWAASRQERSHLLDTFCEATGYHRKYASMVLRHGPPPARPRLRRAGRRLTYSEEVVTALQVVAEATGWICGKRLAPFLPEIVPALEREGALVLKSELRTALLSMSAATIDRRLARARQRANPHGLGTTKPGSLLKQQIPIRTYTPWDDQRAGFVEIDLVAHCGTSAAGEYLCTLTMTDLATGWTLCRAVPNKGQCAVVEALEALRDRLPFPLLGIDSDNGSEFINAHLLRYCQTEQLTFTRCRAYHKNDQAHVEQKNWSVVRQLIGYDRYEGQAACDQLNRIYDLLAVYVNAWLPVMKLTGKERQGSKVRKQYDTAMTPYRRALVAAVVTPEDEETIEQQIKASGPMALRHRLDAERAGLWAGMVGCSSQPVTLRAPA
jgi:hypothetical protein